MFCLKRGKEVWWVIQSSSKSLWQLKLHRSQTDIKKSISTDDWPQPVVIPPLSCRSFWITPFSTALGEKEVYGFGNKTIFSPLNVLLLCLLWVDTHYLLPFKSFRTHSKDLKTKKKKKHPSLTWISLSHKLFRTTLEGPCTVTVPDFFQLLRNKMCLVTV